MLVLSLIALTYISGRIEVVVWHSSRTILAVQIVVAAGTVGVIVVVPVLVVHATSILGMLRLRLLLLLLLLGGTYTAHHRR